MKPVKNPATLMEAVQFFSDEDRALAFFANIRWPNGVCCPHCGSVNVTFLANQRRWKCNEKHPRRQFSAKVGTVFEDSPLSLSKWMVAVWLETNAKNSISSYEVHRALGITQKSAWFMQHRIRLALQSGTFTKMGADGSSMVEADETYIGGKARNLSPHRRAKSPYGQAMVGKTPVMGLLERHTDKSKLSKVRTFVMENTRGHSLHEVIHKHVEPGASISTDAHKGYRGLNPTFVHAVVDHAEKYVDGNVHTNGLENFWALFKRCIKGTHVSCEPFHLFRYLDAECFRFNNRKMNDAERFGLALRGAPGKRVTYKVLTGNDPERRIADDDDADLPN